MKSPRRVKYRVHREKIAREKTHIFPAKNAIAKYCVLCDARISKYEKSQKTYSGYICEECSKDEENVNFANNVYLWM